MALIELEEIWSGEANTYTGDHRRGDFEEDRKFVRRYRALEDDHTLSLHQTYLNALNTVGFPQKWEAHPDVPELSVKDYNVEFEDQNDIPEQRIITVSYTLQTDPTGEPAVVDYDDTSEERVIEGAYGDSPLHQAANALADGRIPILNSAYDPPDPPPTFQEPYRLLRVKKNFAANAFDPSILDPQFVLKVNSANFAVQFPDGRIHSFAVDTVLLDRPPKGRQAFRNNVEFWETEWVFKVRQRGWKYLLADLGFRTWNFVTEKPVPIFINGQPPVNPQKLDGFGALQALNGPLVFLPYQIYETVDFNTIGLFP